MKQNEGKTGAIFTLDVGGPGLGTRDYLRPASMEIISALLWDTEDIHQGSMLPWSNGRAVALYFIDLFEDLFFPFFLSTGSHFPIGTVYTPWIYLLSFLSRKFRTSFSFVLTTTVLTHNTFLLGTTDTSFIPSLRFSVVRLVVSSPSCAALSRS